MNKKRAQAWGYDLMAGVTIFVIGIFIFFLFSLNYNSGGDSELDKLRYEASVISDSLLSEGYPQYWNYSDFDEGFVEQIGIMSNGIVNQTKLDQFYLIANSSLSGEDNGENYTKTRNIFNVPDQFWIDFDEVLFVSDGKGGIVEINGIGNFSNTLKNVIKMDRIISNGTKIKTIKIYVWN